MSKFGSVKRIDILQIQDSRLWARVLEILVDDIVVLPALELPETSDHTSRTML